MKTMKKYLFMLIGLLLVGLPSCTDKDDVEIEYGTTLNITAEHIFDSYRAIDVDFVNMKNVDNLYMELLSLVYDDKGELVDQHQMHTKDIKDVLTHKLSLSPGKYKSISIVRFGMKEGNDDYYFMWNTYDIDNISTFYIKEILALKYGGFGFFETLGINMEEIVVTDRVNVKNISVLPATSLVQVFLWGESFTNYLGTNGYSDVMPHCQEINIYAPDLKQRVKFANGEIQYEYGEMGTLYTVGTFYPQTYYMEGQPANHYGYRAFLPIEDRDFWWDIKFAPGKGYQFVGSDFAESERTTKLNIKSGKQYVLDLILDGFYLFAEDYNADEDDSARKRRHAEELNRMNFEKIVDHHFEIYLGSSKDDIENEFGTGKLVGKKLTYTGYNYNITKIVFEFDDDFEHVQNIKLSFSIASQFKEQITEYLDNRFKFSEAESAQNNRIYYDSPSALNATLQVIWNLKNSTLTYIKL